MGSCKPTRNLYMKIIVTKFNKFYDNPLWWGFCDVCISKNLRMRVKWVANSNNMFIPFNALLEIRGSFGSLFMIIYCPNDMECPFVFILIIVHQIHELGESTTCYRWIGWGWEVTDKSSRLREYYRSLYRDLENIPQINKENPKDVNVNWLWLGNTRVSIDYAQNFLGQLHQISKGYFTHKPRVVIVKL